MRKNITEVRDWLLENCVDGDGDLDLIGLDFSDFDCDIYISGIKVKKDLGQSEQNVEGSLFQGNQVVKNDLIQMGQLVRGDLYQNSQIVKGDLLQNEQTVNGRLFQNEKSKLLIKTIKKLIELDDEELQDVLNSLLVKV